MITPRQKFIQQMIMFHHGKWPLPDDCGTAYCSAFGISATSWAYNVYIIERQEFESIVDLSKTVYVSNITQEEYDQLHEEIALKDELISEQQSTINKLSAMLLDYRP